MSWFSRFSRSKDPMPDPTAGWPESTRGTPVVTTDPPSVGGLSFGDSLLDARSHGRPDRFRWRDGTYCELLYAQHGYQLDFDDGRFVYAAFMTGPDDCSPDAAPLAFAQVAIDAHVFGADSTRESVVAAMGQPESIDVDVDETIIVYRRANLVVEMELDAGGFLKRVNLYQENDP